MDERLKVLSVFGTRPEAIKMAPVLRELQRNEDRVRSVVCVTAQHREMLDQVLGLFGIVPDYDLDIMQNNQKLTETMVNTLVRVGEVLEQEQPDWVLVQGDTTTVMAASLAAFYRRVKIGHVEAGLRTWDRFQPYPEEVNRKVVDAMADLHFAPTDTARANLLQEGIAEEGILVTGNTVIDALLWAAEQPCPIDVRDTFYQFGLCDPSASGGKETYRYEEKGNGGRRLILVTAHRRENFGEPLENICRALKEIAKMYPGMCIVYPVHPNPNVRGPVYRILSGIKNITLLPPLDYLSFVHLMKRSTLILTDSGGLQEEAPSLGIPLLVLRDVTERPEAVAAEAVRVVGTRWEAIVGETSRLLEDREAYEQMARAVNPYGDGKASERIVQRIMGGSVRDLRPIRDRRRLPSDVHRLSLEQP